MQTLVLSKHSFVYSHIHTNISTSKHSTIHTTISLETLNKGKYSIKDTTSVEI